MHLLEAGDGAERRVVHHEPDDVDAGFHCSRDHRRIRAEAAVTDQCDRMTFRLRNFHTERGGRTEAHLRETAWCDECAGDIDWKLLTNTVLVPAHIRDDECVGRSRATQLGENAFGAERELRRGPLICPVAGKLSTAARDLFLQRTAIRVPLAARFVSK